MFTNLSSEDWLRCYTSALQEIKERLESVRTEQVVTSGESLSSKSKAARFLCLPAF